MSMETDERTQLLRRVSLNNGLSGLFAVICVVDVFGVFPVVVLPKPIIDCGFYGILIIIVVCSTQIYTAILLGKCWTLAEEMEPSINRKSRYPYSALAEMAFNKYISHYVTFLVDLTVFSGGIPNLIVAAQNLQFLGLKLSNSTFDLSACYWIIILGSLLCPVLWLGSPKDMKVLCTISVLIVSSVFLLTCGCLLFTANGPSASPIIDEEQELWKSVITAYGIVAFQFDIHPTILTIQMDMSDKSKLDGAIIGGFIVSLFMFGTTTLIAAIKYGQALVRPSILETVPSTIPLHLAAALVAVQLCLTSAVSNNALYQHLENCLNISREFNRKRCIMRTILTFLAIVIAESVPRFDLVMSLIGGTLIGPLVFILPPLFYIRMLKRYDAFKDSLEKESFSNVILPGTSSMIGELDYSENLVRYYENKFKKEFYPEAKIFHMGMCSNKGEVALCALIILVSILTTGITTYLNFSNAAISYKNFSTPCIYNVSNALLYL